MRSGTFAAGATFVKLQQAGRALPDEDPQMFRVAMQKCKRGFSRDAKKEVSGSGQKDPILLAFALTGGKCTTVAPFNFVQ